MECYYFSVWTSREFTKFHAKLMQVFYRNGGSSVFQITLHKNINAYPRVYGVTNHASIHVTPSHEIK